MRRTRANPSVLCLFWGLQLASGFLVGGPAVISRSLAVEFARNELTQVTTSTALHAKKRRRKKDAEGTSPSSELPDFDLAEDGGMKKESKSTEPSSEAISNAMMGSSDRPARSIDELIADRSLEKNFEFDEPTDDSLPDLAGMPRVGDEAVGSKRAKRDARRAVAEQRLASEEENKNPLSDIPFLQNDAGEVTGVKVWIFIMLPLNFVTCIYESTSNDQFRCLSADSRGRNMVWDISPGCLGSVHQYPPLSTASANYSCSL